MSTRVFLVRFSAVGEPRFNTASGADPDSLPLTSVGTGPGFPRAMHRIVRLEALGAPLDGAAHEDLAGFHIPVDLTVDYSRDPRSPERALRRSRVGDVAIAFMEDVSDDATAPIIKHASLGAGLSPRPGLWVPVHLLAWLPVESAETAERYSRLTPIELARTWDAESAQRAVGGTDIW